jgi:hypothetical protein
LKAIPIMDNSESENSEEFKIGMEMWVFSSLW